VLVAHDQLLPVAEGALGQVAVEHLFATSFLDFLPPQPAGTLPPNLLAPRAASARARDLMGVLAQQSTPPAAVQPSLDALAALNYTGGTTGMPKGCMHSQRNMLYTGAVMSSISADIGRDDVVVNFWPVFWMAGEDVGILLPVVTGATCVLLARWDPVGFIEAVERYRATVAFMLVDNAVQVIEHDEAHPGRLASLRETLVASFVKKLNPAYRERWRTLTGATLREAAWGMTETHSFDTFTRGSQDDDTDLKARQVFCGLPVPGTAFKILEFGSDRLLPLGEEGELCVRSPSLLKGYWNRPQATAESIAGGWLRTGDLGMIGTDGCIHFFGRRKEMLKVKGMSVFPAEIEAVLGQHPAVTGSGVVGREDEQRGQVPVAFVTLHPGQRDNVTPEEIIAFCRARLAVYKIPELRIVESLPMTATGKVRKDELIALLPR
jgi:acyl-CoA synthetase (AMP-forming)/AMP-acid ligase II